MPCCSGRQYPAVSQYRRGRPEKSAPDRISAATAFCSQNQIRYRFVAPQFMDASGDGVLACLPPRRGNQGGIWRDVRPGCGIRPPPRSNHHTRMPTDPLWPQSSPSRRSIRSHAIAIGTHTQGCHLWWFEYGGRHDPMLTPRPSNGSSGRSSMGYGIISKTLAIMTISPSSGSVRFQANGNRVASG